MSISFRLADNGSPHVCAHRGYSLRYPENTILALDAARRAGATTCEVDAMLTRDGEAVLFHDDTLDRVTGGSGFLADHDLEAIRALEVRPPIGGAGAPAAVPTLAEALSWAKEFGMGLELEIKARRHRGALMRRVVEVLAETDGFGHVIVISFDHVDLARMREHDDRIRTEAITHARHADIVGVLRACGAEAASIELDMFHPDDARALHDAGLYHRVHLPVPAKLVPYWAAGEDPRARVKGWLAEGLIDSISGDDVPFLRAIAADAEAVRAD